MLVEIGLRKLFSTPVSKISPNSPIIKFFEKILFLDFSFVPNLKIEKNLKLDFKKKIIIGLFGLILGKFCPKLLNVTEHLLTFYSMRKNQNAKRANSSQSRNKESP